jgi:carboxyl-terminal processing protease
MEGRWMDDSENHKPIDTGKVYRRGVVAGVVVTLLITIVLVVVIVVGGFLLPQLFTVQPVMIGSPVPEQIQELDYNDKLQEIKEILRRDFLFMDEVNEEELVEGIFRGFVNALGDPYTTYFDQETTERLAESRRGSYYGIGARLRVNPDLNAVEIVNTFEGSPAKAAGLQAGDIIVQVDDRVIKDEELSEVVSWIRGDIGTTVDLVVSRNRQIIHMTVERANIQVPTVSHEMLENNIGFIQIQEFDMLTGDQFEEAMSQLNEEGMEGLIIDLRYNPGGSLTTVIGMLKNILPAGIIVTMEDVHGNVMEERSDGRNAFNRPMVVLVNGFSASASEIFAGAVQDHGIATIVGTETFGKGLVQRVFNLSDGSSMNVTIAEYFTPNRQRITEHGIIPDIEVEFDYHQEVEEDEEKDDAQLSEAIRVIRSML